MYEYILLKLVTAEVIIGRIDSLSETEVTLEYPMLVNFVDNPLSGTTQVYVSVYNPFFKENQYLVFKRKFIIFDSPVDEEYSEFYERFVARTLKTRDQINSEDEIDEEIAYLENLSMDANTSIN